MAHIKAHISDPSGVRRESWPVSTGVPFAKGQLASAEHIRVVDAGGEELPSHADVRATWPDGSIKWVLLDFQMDIEPMEERHFAIEFGPEVQRGPAPDPVRLKPTDGGLTLDTGALQATVGTTGGRLLRRAQSNGGDCILPGQEGEFSATDAEGREYHSRVDSAKVEEQNPFKVVIVASGGLEATDGVRLLSWIVRIHAYAGKSFLRLHHTFVHDQPVDFVYLRQLRLSLPFAEDGAHKVFFGARVGGFSSAHEGEPTERVTVIQPKPSYHLVKRADEDAQKYRTNFNGWVHISGKRTGMTVKLRRPSQSYPKAMSTDGRAIDLDLFPMVPAEEAADSGPGMTYREIMEEERGVLHVGLLKVPEGMARTHEIFLSFGPPKADARKADMECIAFEQPLLPVLPSTWYADSGALGSMAPFLEDHWPLERRLREMCELPNGAGILNDGDLVRLREVDGEVRTITTDNVAYDISRSLVRTFMRTGHQMTFWAAEAGVHHLVDVDTVHANRAHPKWVGGPHMQWSQNHHYRTMDEVEHMSPVTSHTWIGGILDFYFLTGHRRAWDAACKTAEFCRVNAPVEWLEGITPEAKARVLDPEQPWPYSTRVAGWPLVAMGEMYAVTREKKFVAPMKKLVDLFLAWQDEGGKWRDQTGSFNRGSKPFMIASILTGLQRYYENFGGEEVIDALVRGARHMAVDAKTAEGIMYYTEGPYSDRAHTSDIMLLGPMAFAYEQSGDPDILDAAYRHFRWMVDGRQCATYTHKDVFAFLPLAHRMGLLDDYKAIDVKSHVARKGKL